MEGGRALLVQRGTQLSRLRSTFLQVTSGGRGHVTLVTGAVGAGKTALLEEFTGWAVAEGARVLCATGSVSERDSCFAVLGSSSSTPGSTGRPRPG